MTNEQLNNYRSFTICDSHLHLVYQDTLEKTIQIYTNIMDHYGYERIVLQCMLNSFDTGDAGNNAKALYVKTVMNEADSTRKVYANGAMFHYYDGRDTAEGVIRLNFGISRKFRRVHWKEAGFMMRPLPLWNSFARR